MTDNPVNPVNVPRGTFLKITINMNTILNQFTLSGQIVDLENRIIFSGEVLVEGTKIKDIRRTNTTNRNYILPGFVDAHVHIESSMLTPEKFSQLAVKHGTVAVVSDPHEIANVMGVDGINFMIQNAKKAHIKIFFGLPSCVPATDFESSGARINAEQTRELLKRSDLFFLSEMMNFPGVLNHEQEVMLKIAASQQVNKPIDGHAPGLNSEQISMYINTGISTDHECTNLEEAYEKIKHGMTIQIREGSAAKNFDTLSSLIDSHPDSVMLCTDDSHPDDLAERHINSLVDRAISKHYNLFNILRAASYNAVKHYKLPVGLLQVGDPADFIIIDNFEDFNVEQVYINGNSIQELNEKASSAPILINNFHRNRIIKSDLSVKKTGNFINVIEAFDNELYTKAIKFPVSLDSEFIESDIKNDILKIAVINRYENYSKPVIGFIKNFGLKQGGIGGSIAHDSHNIIAISANDDDLLNVINNIIDNKGGIALSNNGNIHSLSLPVAGLMSNDNPTHVARQYREMNRLAVEELGSSLNNPFMTLSFMALLVIPEIKIGDKGLFDSTNFKLINLFD